MNARHGTYKTAYNVGDQVSDPYKTPGKINSSVYSYLCSDHNRQQHHDGPLANTGLTNVRSQTAAALKRVAEDSKHT